MLCAADAHIWQRAVIQGFRLCDAITCGLVRGSRWGGFIAVRVVPVCAVEVGSAWSRRAWRATFRGTKRLAIAENIYKSHWESSLGLFAVWRAAHARGTTQPDAKGCGRALACFLCLSHSMPWCYSWSPVLR